MDVFVGFVVYDWVVYVCGVVYEVEWGVEVFFCEVYFCVVWVFVGDLVGVDGGY